MRAGARCAQEVALPPYYSHSRISCFEDCPKRFQYRYLLRLPAETESIEAFVGKRVHEVLERLHQFVDREMVPSLNKVLARYVTLWDENWNGERVRIVREGTRVDDYRAIGDRCLRQYFRQHYPFDRDETLGLEERVTVVLDAAREHRIQGFIDRLVRAPDGVIEIQDYKTSRRMPSQKRLDEDRQLALYQLAVQSRYPDTPIRLVWHYLAQGATRVSTRSMQQLEELRTATSKRIDEIESAEHFEARPSALCGWCEFRDVCPAADGSAETERAALAARRPPAAAPLAVTPPDSQLDLL
jgi:putative RecB family exonuclease